MIVSPVLGARALRQLADLRKHARAGWTVVSPTRPSHVRPDRLVRVAFGTSIGAPPASVRRPARVRHVRGFVNGDVALIKIERTTCRRSSSANPRPWAPTPCRSALRSV
jgi:hypothetical protein